MNFKVVVTLLVLSLAYESNAYVASGKCASSPSLSAFEPNKVLKIIFKNTLKT